MLSKKGGSMSKIQPEDLVLVAIVKTPRDLEIARVLGWYRIPLATAPKTIRVDWIAFYQTAAFGDERWSVRYVASVRGYELVTREELLRDERDHPRAKEPYFKLQLGPVEALPKPIPSQHWRRFTFLYSTGDRLLAAADLKDLKVRSSREKDSLWKLLAERRMPYPEGSPIQWN
jgi:hypothetical protein